MIQNTYEELAKELDGINKELYDQAEEATKAMLELIPDLEAGEIEEA